jgi:oligopeptide transport system substrate-binding protein
MMSANNILKYQRIDATDRAKARRDWNQPVMWPLLLGMVLLLAALVPAIVGYRRRERKAVMR